MSTVISQLSCFSSLYRRRLHLRSLPYPSPKVLVVRSQDTNHPELSSSDSKFTLSYTEAAAVTSNNGRSGNPVSNIEEHGNGKATSQTVDHVVTEQKNTAKIHDFCFGIPFGGLVLSVGLVGFLFSRNPATLSTGVLLGGSLLFLSTFSLKVWRQGNSSLPYILGQAVISAVLLWKNLQSYLMTKKVFPTAFYAVVSAAMLCFYTYVVISGGNPPPKKFKSSATVPS